MTTVNPNPDQQPTNILPDVLYSLTGLDQVGFGRTAVKKMRDQGLPVRYECNRGFVLGVDLIQHILQNGDAIRPQDKFRHQLPPEN